MVKNLLFGCTILLLCTTCREVDDFRPNGKPVAVAGPNLSVNTGSPVTLDGSASSDPDDDALSYQWICIQRPPQSLTSINPFDSVTASFTADIPGIYIIVLKISDNMAVATDTVNVSIIQPNRAPTANAGNDGNAQVGQLYNLQGSGADADGNSINFQWSFASRPAGSAAVIQNNTSATASFTPDLEGNYKAVLAVTDGQLTTRDTVVITTTTNHPPVANAGPDGNGVTGQVYTLNGSGSDPDGNPITFAWTLPLKPQGSVANISDATAASTTFTPDVAGTYTAVLSVTDGTLTDKDTVVVTVTLANAPPVANAGNDASVDVGTVVALNGSASDPNNDALTYNWVITTKPAGSSAAIANPASAVTSFVVDRPGSYLLTLNVSDGVFNVADQLTFNTNPVVVSGINPTSGPYGITVKISGSNFSPQTTENTVRFNGMIAAVTSASPTGLDVVVPKGAGTGVVSVMVNNITSNGPVFTYVTTPTVSTVVTQFNLPYNMVSDSQGNLYIADYATNVIRLLTPQGVLSVYAGQPGVSGLANGKNNDALFNGPAGVALDEDSQLLYVSDYGNHLIRVINMASAVVSTFAGSTMGYTDATGGQARFNNPLSLALDNADNLYVGDLGNYRIRKITPAAVVTTYAGSGQPGFVNGQGIAAQFNGISGMVFDPNNVMYVADAGNHAIRMISATGNVTTLAGNGTQGFVNATGASARFRTPFAVARGNDGNIYVTDSGNHAVRRVTPAGAVTTIAGNGTSGNVDGVGSVARFSTPGGIAITPAGSILIGDLINQAVRKIIFE